MQKIRCAIIGTGRIASLLEDDKKREKPASHAGAIYKNKETELVGGADSDDSALQVFGKRWKLDSSCLFSSAEEMLDVLKPDIVHIASDTDWHIRHLLMALERNSNIIVLEKPVVTSIKEALKAGKIIKKSSSRIIVNHERRFANDYIHVRERIKSKVHGELLCIYGRLYMGKKKKVNEVLWHDGTHMIDLIRFLLDGDFKPVQKIGDPFSSGNNVFLVGSKGRCSLVMDCSPGRDHLHFELELSFEEGRIRVGNGIYSEETSGPSPYYAVYRSLLPVKMRFRKTGYFSNMMDHAVELFHNPAMKSRSDFYDGLKALQLIQEFLEMNDRI
jgi:predicted dehydrogenase